MSVLGDWLNERQLDKFTYDQFLYGTGCLEIKNRSAYNPLYWILGHKKIHRIKPDQIYIKTKER